VEAVAASIESGVFDHAAIDPLVTAAEAAHATTAPLLEAAAQRLHDTLDASQRQALVDALQARHAGKHGHHPFALGGEHGHEPLTLVADALGLDTAQRATIHERFRAARGEEAAHPHGDRAAHRARLRAIADAFVSDAFDAHALGLGAMAAHEHPRGHRLALLEAALPVLTPVQRASLARMVRSGAI
jgi:Spy/CpxP family protein refolding chaperone